MVGIYRITSPSGRINIGQSWNIDDRRREYKCYKGKGQPVVEKSIKKYGWENHKFEVLYELPESITQEILDSYEIFCISQYKDAEYKMMNVREGGSRGKHAEESKEKIRQTLTGRKRNWSPSLDHRRKTSRLHKGKKHTQEAKDKISRANKGRKQTPEQIKRRSENMKGHKMHPNTKSNIEQGRQNYIHNRTEIYKCKCCGFETIDKGSYRSWHGEDGERCIYKSVGITITEYREKYKYIDYDNKVIEKSYKRIGRLSQESKEEYKRLKKYEGCIAMFYQYEKWKPVRIELVTTEEEIEKGGYKSLPYEIRINYTTMRGRVYAGLWIKDISKIKII